MRVSRWLLGLILLLAVIVPAQAQQAPPTTTKTLTSATCPGTGCLIVGSAGYGGLGVQVSGTFSATIVFEGIVSGDTTGTYTAVTCTPWNSTTGVTSTTAAGLWGCPVGGLSFFRVRVSSYTSGSAVITTLKAPTLARGSGGGGGGGGIGGGISQYEIALGSGTDTITGIAPGTSGYVLTSNGAGANPTYQAPASGGAGFNALTSGTNTTAAMVVGTGSTLGATGSGTITATAVPVGGISGLGTGVATALAVNIGSAGAFVTFNGALGTPSSGTATNLTGLPLSTGVTGRLPYANLTASTAASKILGRTDASAGDWQEITLGTGLTMSGTTLNASGGGITIGTTTITSGTNGRFLYDNSGVVGEATVTGTLGNVVLSDTPTLTTPNITTSATLTRTSIGTTSADGLVLQNTTAAAAGAQQYSPRLRLTGQGWKTNATAASQTVDWIAENQPIQGAANPKTVLALLSQVNAGGYVSQVEVRPFGTSGSSDFELFLNNAGSLRTVIRSAGLGGSIAFNAQNVDGRRNLFLDYNGLVQTTATGVFSWSSSSTDAQTGGDLFLYRDAANTLAQYNSTSAQAHRIYNTRTDASNGEWATINWASNVLHIGATKNGTGTARVMQLDYGGTTTAAISVPITSGQVTFGGGFVAGGTQTLGANYHEMTEMTAPSAPATNSVRVYAEDTGGGKTRLCALFPTGAAQCFATEP